MLETHLIDFSTLETNALNVQSQITSAEEAVSVRLDTTRNDNLMTDVALSCIACGITTGGYLANIFGMNMDNTNPSSLVSVQGGFVVISTMSFVAILVVIVVGYIYLKASGILPERLMLSLKRLLLPQVQQKHKERRRRSI